MTAEALVSAAAPATRPAVGVESALRLASGRTRLWAWGLTAIGLIAVIGAPLNHWHDWGALWAAGATAGTGALVPAGPHLDWQAAHGVSQAFFAYPPAAAWLLWPLAQFPVDVSFWLQGALMIACLVAAGLLAARVYGLTPELAVLASLAWAPSTASIVTGQNAPFALLLALVAIWAVARDRPLVAGAAVGALLYKPTLAAPFVLLFLVRGRWRELAVVVAAGAAAYLLSVAAAGGDWGWPATWWADAQNWLPADAAKNADKAVSLPGLLARLPVPYAVPLLAGAALVLVAIPGLRRAPIAEAAAAAALLGLAAGPRVWGYEAALAFPFVCWVLSGGVGEPWRTRLVVAAYLLAPLWLFSGYTLVNSVAVIVIVAIAVWLVRRPPLTSTPVASTAAAV